jgi:hypothetical protein
VTDEDLFRLGIYRICEALHMSANGSSDPLPDETRELYADYLSRRIKDWDIVSSSMFDDAMFILVNAAIDEAADERARKSEPS